MFTSFEVASTLATQYLYGHTANESTNFAMNPIVIIPARMASSRLPGKPLAEIAGKAMVTHVADRAHEANVGPVYVAAAEPEIADEVTRAGYHAVLTDPALPSGTDRVKAAIDIIDPDNTHDIIINLQGDMPTVDPTCVHNVLAPFADSSVDITTLANVIEDSDELADPNTVKAIANWHGNRGTATDFTRTVNASTGDVFYHHIGIYAYRRAALERFCSLPPSPREKSEKLEQLRAMEAGMRIDVMQVQAVPFGVDTPEDLEKARAILA